MKRKTIISTIVMCMLMCSCGIENNTQTEKTLDNNEIIETRIEETVKSTESIQTTQIHIAEMSTELKSSEAIESDTEYEEITIDNYMDAFNEFLYEGKSVPAELNKSDWSFIDVQDNYTLDGLLDDFASHFKLDEYTKLSYGFFDAENDGINDLMVQACFSGSEQFGDANFNIICQYYDNQITLTQFYIVIGEGVAISYYGTMVSDDIAEYVSAEGYVNILYQKSTEINAGSRMYDENAYDTCFTSEPEIQVSCYGIEGIDKMVFLIEYENETKEIKNYISEVAKEDYRIVVSKEELDKLIEEAYANHRLTKEDLHKEIELEELIRDNN